jgi:hypothetical protein
MTQTSKPNKQAVRDHMARRIAQQQAPEHKPPPEPEAIRRQLGWHMLPNNRSK